jgi:hypothetical protein
MLVVGIRVGAGSESAEAFYQGWSGAATFWGFIVGIVGFALTIWTVLQVEKVNREAQQQVGLILGQAQVRVELSVQRAQQTVERAEQQTREATTRIGEHLLVWEGESLTRLVLAAIQAAETLQWNVVLAMCQEAAHAGVMLAANPVLEENERTALRAASDELTVIMGWVRKNRAEKAASASLVLPAQQLDRLLAMRRLVSEIQARLRGRMLGVFHASYTLRG